MAGIALMTALGATTAVAVATGAIAGNGGPEQMDLPTGPGPSDLVALSAGWLASPVGLDDVVSQCGHAATEDVQTFEVMTKDVAFPLRPFGAKTELRYIGDNPTYTSLRRDAQGRLTVDVESRSPGHGLKSAALCGDFSMTNQEIVARFCLYVPDNLFTYGANPETRFSAILPTGDVGIDVFPTKIYCGSGRNDLEAPNPGVPGAGAYNPPPVAPAQAAPDSTYVLGDPPDPADSALCTEQVTPVAKAYLRGDFGPVAESGEGQTPARTKAQAALPSERTGRWLADAFDAVYQSGDGDREGLLFYVDRVCTEGPL